MLSGKSPAPLTPSIPLSQGERGKSEGVQRRPLQGAPWMGRGGPAGNKAGRPLGTAPTRGTPPDAFGHPLGCHWVAPGVNPGSRFALGSKGRGWTWARGLLLLFALCTASAHAEPLVIVGGTVHTLGPQGTVENATVVIEGGKIVSVSTGAPPPGARVIDATGKVVTPGLFDSLSQLGLVEVGMEAATNDQSTDDPRYTAAFAVADALNPYSILIPVNRIEGLTRALVGPRGKKSPIAGQGAVIDLSGDLPGRSRSFLTRTPAALFVTLGEAGAGRAGGSRASALTYLREAFEDARDFEDNTSEYRNNQRRAYALSRPDLEALEPFLKGDLPVAIEVHRASDILHVLRFADQWKLRLVILGGAEAWRVADALAAAQVPVVLNPLANLPASFEQLGATLENAARLHAAGVTVIFGTGDSHNGRNLKQAAGNAVAYGLPWEEGLKAMTVHPARVWGVAERYGTLEPGKDADVVVWDGDPLEVTTYADVVLIRGAEIPMKSRQTLLRERYRDVGDTAPVGTSPTGTWPPAYSKPN